MIRRIRQLVLLILGLLLVGALVVYVAGIRKNAGAEKDIDNKEGREKPLIGISVDGMVLERWQRDIEILKASAVELGFDVVTVNAYEDAKKQNEQIRALIKEGADAIFILPYDKDSLSQVVSEAQKEGIIVVSYDRLITGANVDLYVSFDNIRVGEEMAQALLDAVPTGNYVVINGSPLDYNSEMFREGFFNILQPAIEEGRISILKEVWANNWREDVAYNTVSQLLQEGETIDGIIGANDLLAEGAISVLSEYGLVGQVQVVGHDAEISACQRIVEGKQLMTVYKPLKNLAKGSMEVVADLLKGKALSYDDKISDGIYQVPYLKFDVIPVFEDNMRQTIIKDFFHSEEDVYRNLQEEDSRED